MMWTIFLDTSPLGLLTNPKKPPLTISALQWAASHIRSGNRIMVPSIADYEVRRELIRLGRTNGIASQALEYQTVHGLAPNAIILRP